jgi:glutathione S-transferase
MGSLSEEVQMKPLVLHSFATSPNPLKIAIALELLRLPYQVEIWEFGSDPTTGVKGAKFAPLSENGRVPVLEDPNTGVVAWESGAVMNYIRRQYDKDEKVLGLGGKTKNGVITEQDRVDMEKYELLLLTTVAPFSGQLVWYTYVQRRSMSHLLTYRADTTTQSRILMLGLDIRIKSCVVTGC